MATEVRASVTRVPIPAQKVRLVVDMVRGKNVQQALDILRFEKQKSAKHIDKLLKSAVANAEQNMGIGRDELFIAEVLVDEGPTRKWRRFGARGRFKPWLKRSANIKLVLREREGSLVD